MFHVEFVTDDKKFGEVMASLSGKVMNLQWRHLTNTKVERGKVVADNPSGSVREAVIKSLLKDKDIAAGKKRFSGKDLQAVVLKLGGSKNSIGPMLRAFTDQKLIRKVGYGKFVLVREKRTNG